MTRTKVKVGNAIKFQEKQLAILLKLSVLLHVDIIYNTIKPSKECPVQWIYRNVEFRKIIVFMTYLRAV